MNLFLSIFSFYQTDSFHHIFWAARFLPVGHIAIIHIIFLRRIRLLIRFLVIYLIRLAFIFQFLTFDFQIVQPWIFVEVVLVADLVGHRVHQDVDADYFVEFVDSQFAEGLDGFEINVAGAGDPEGDGYCPKQLNTQLPKTVLISFNYSLLAAKYADVEEAEEAADAMDLHCFYWVVDSESLEDLDCDEVDDAWEEPYSDGSINIHIMAHIRYHHQAHTGSVHYRYRKILLAFLLFESIE